MPIDISAFPPLLRLAQVGEHRYEGKPEYEGEVVRNVVFGGQVLAQAIVAAHIDRNEDRVDDKEVKSIHAIFARAGDYNEPIVYDVERMHDGRTLGSDTNESVWAGRGRTHGRINIWTTDGRLVATCTQYNLVRGWADGKDHTADYSRIM